MNYGLLGLSVSDLKARNQSLNKFIKLLFARIDVDWIPIRIVDVIDGQMPHILPILVSHIQAESD